MKVKDLERTANIAWSPSNEHPIFLAAGTAGQQLDASFNTNAVIEIYSLNLSEPGLDMEPKVSVPAEHRFHKLIWGSYDKSSEHGTIVGGCDRGLIEIYNVSKLLNKERGLVACPSKHTGPVSALDFNPFQSNLLASGAGESEIYIWDLNNTTTPMTPGVKSQPFEDVQCVAWNRQVQHILASTFPSKCVVWDLRKNEPIIKLTDTVSRIRWKVIAWHPEVATQLCLASEEDQAPVIQLWDLRFATSPLKTLENHQRGILSIAWCQQDVNLLVSCGKDNRILCWNPNSNTPGGEVLSEVAKTNQWNFDVTWCPKNPALIACPSFDGHVSVYSVMGGKIQQVQTTNKIADSFPGMDGYAQAPEPQQSTPASVDLSKPPKWLKRPIGARFGFGGKLITFENEGQPTQNQSPVARTVFVSQVITESELVEQSAQLEQALEYGNFTEYCRNKADSLSDQHKRNIWYFLKANFEADPRGELLNLLGYKKDEINNKLNEIVGVQANVDGLTDQFSNLNQPGSYENSFGLDQFGSQEAREKVPYRIKTGDDVEGLITQALLLGNLEAAVELCLKAQRFADAIIIAMSGGSELLARTQYKYLQQSEGYVSSLISALVLEDWSSVINNCDISSWKEALAATLTHSSSDDLPKLCELLGNRLEAEGKAQDAQLCYICAGNFEKLVNSWSKTIKKSSSELQELVELVTFLQKSIERQGRRVEITGSLADLLAYYASILASQGNLTVALSYLGSSQDQKIADLRDRLSVSLGYKSAYPQVAQRSRHSSRQSFSNYLNPVTPPVPSYNFNTALPTQPWQTQNQAPLPAQPFSPPPVSQPPRPTSVGSAHGGISSRAKYVVDPSVHSNNPYGARNQFNTNPYSAPNPAPVANTQQLIPNLPPMPQSPANFHNPPPPNPAAFHNQPPEPALAAFAPPPPQSGWNDPPALRRSTPRLPPEGYNMSAVHAGTRRWKNKSNKVEAKQSDYVQQDPITHPLYGVAPSQTLPSSNGFVEPIQSQPFVPNAQPFAPNAQPFAPNALYNPNFEPPPMQPPLVPTGFMPPSPNPDVYHQNAIPNVQPPVVPAAAVEAPAPIIQKAPLSGEQKLMQIVFDDLRGRCSANANNPQTKRKLEDVGKKLEFLYDLLREDKLSPNTLSGLHQLVQLVQSGDYSNSLSLHTQLVSGPDFAQIASFMPGLKVLIQCALQLQVYLR
ncbi:protein transport protein Sec31A isoform X2 [Photinus pyralis]|uniref:protein transport protein Sec31A isoform X2 n=1 Tax=Photinus pyralis TaxID=7054 RepID=UPI0012670E04|nr:protein transport protein Sec31A isoform X2 [Photinus pyralis]